MAYDYTDDVAFAVEMVAEFGRAIRFVLLNETVNDADPLAAPPAPALSAPVPAVFVAPTGVVDLGATATTRDLLKGFEQVAIVAPSAIDYEAAEKVRDHDGSEWKIGRVLKFQPGDTALLYYIGVNR